MDQLELVFRLLFRLQFMYFQYNVYLSIVVRTSLALPHPPSLLYGRVWWNDSQPFILAIPISDNEALPLPSHTHRDSNLKLAFTHNFS